MINRLLLLILPLALLAATANCGKPEVVRIGVCLSLSGGFQESGRKALAGVRMRVDDFNSRADETDVRLELVVRDDASLPGTAARMVRELAVEEKVPAIIGPLSTSLMLEMRPIAREFGVVLISPSVTSPEIGKEGDWAFRVLFDDAFQGVILAKFVRHTLGLRLAGLIINDQFSYAGSVAEAFAEQFRREGGRVKVEEHYSWVVDEESDYDFSTILDRVVAADPDIVVLPLHSIEVASVIRQSTLSGFEARFCGGDTWQHEVVYLSSGNKLDGSFFVSGIDFDSGSTEMVKFRYLYDHSHDPDAQLTSVLGYDAASLVIEGLKNGRDGESIRAGLYKIRNLELASGTITIDPQRGSEKSAFIQRIDWVNDLFASTVIEEIKP